MSSPKLPVRCIHRVAANPDSRERGVIALRMSGVDPRAITATAQIVTGALALQPGFSYHGIFEAFVMAPFTMPYESRLSDGSYGVLYAANNTRTAAIEHRFHLERWARQEMLQPQIFRRIHVEMEAHAHLANLRGDSAVSDPNTYEPAQRRARCLYEARRPGALYRSARAPGNTCIGIFIPAIIRSPKSATMWCLRAVGRSTVYVIGNLLPLVLLGDHVVFELMRRNCPPNLIAKPQIGAIGDVLHTSRALRTFYNSVDL